MLRTFVVWVVVSIGTLAGAQNISGEPAGKLLLQNTAAILTQGREIHDVRLTGTGDRFAGADHDNGDLSAVAEASGELKLSLKYGSGGLVETRAMTEKGPLEKWRKNDEDVHDVIGHNTVPLSPWFFPALLLQRLNTATDVSLSYVGAATRDNGTVEHITVTKHIPALHHPAVMLTLLQKSNQSELYLDSKTGLPSSWEFNTHPDDNLAKDIPVQIKFSDYRVVNGIQSPFRIRKYVNRVLVLDLRVNDVAIDSGASANPSSIE